MKTATEVKISSLYSYQPYTFEYLKQTVLDNLIFLSNPAGFNDPWDCRPHFYSDVDDPNVRKSVINYYAKAYQKAHPAGQINIEDAISQLDKDPEKLKALMAKSSEGLFGDICGQYRVRCLTIKNDNALMWGHYAAKHTGICLEFDVENPVFCAALQVEYNKDYPSFQLTDDSSEANVKILTTKSDHWAYEEEYRLIALESTAKLPVYQTLVVNNGFLTIPEGSLTSVILGCLMPEENKQKIEDLLKASGKKISLKDAVRLPNKYGLEIRDRT